MMFAVAEASTSLQDFITLLVLYLKVELCAGVPLWGDFSSETCKQTNNLEIPEVVCYSRADV